MSEETYLRIYKDKNGEIDFGISCIEPWDYKKQKEIRSMLVTAIYVLEDMWRGERDKLPTNIDRLREIIRENNELTEEN